MAFVTYIKLTTRLYTAVKEYVHANCTIKKTKPKKLAQYDQMCLNYSSYFSLIHPGSKYICLIDFGLLTSVSENGLLHLFVFANIQRISLTLD